MATKRVTISLDEALLDQVDALAGDSDRSRSEQIADLIKESLTPGGTDSAFYLSTELKGVGHDIMPVVRWCATPNDQRVIDLDRRWVVRFYCQAREGEKLYGGMRVAGEGEKIESPIVPKRMK